MPKGKKPIHQRVHAIGLHWVKPGKPVPREINGDFYHGHASIIPTRGVSEEKFRETMEAYSENVDPAGKVVAFVPSRASAKRAKSSSNPRWKENEFTLHRPFIKGESRGKHSHLANRGLVDVHLGELPSYPEHKREIDRAWEREVGGEKRGAPWGMFKARKLGEIRIRKLRKMLKEYLGE